MNLRREDSYWQRTRHIAIATPSHNEQTQLAATLRATPGVEGFELNDEMLSITYDLRVINLIAIEVLLTEHRLEKNISLMQRIKHYLARYREAIVIAEQNIDYGWDVWVQDAYVSRYRLRRHGRRDDRVTNWRMYEQSPTSNSDESAGNRALSSSDSGDRSNG